MSWGLSLTNVSTPKRGPCFPSISNVLGTQGLLHSSFDATDADSRKHTDSFEAARHYLDVDDVEAEEVERVGPAVP